MTRPELITQLEEIAGMVAGWTGIVPPAVATGRVAGRLRALAREVAAEHDPGVVGSDLPPSDMPMEPRAELPEK